MRDLAEIGLDSQCLSYLIDTLEGIVAPTDRLAEQRVALVRLYLYTPGTLWVTPTVEKEFLRIRDEARRNRHVRWTSVHYGVRPLSSVAMVRRRALSLEEYHADVDDRMVLAEAEDIGFATLLCHDTEFLKHLGPHARLRLTRPAECWDRLATPRAATPDKAPTTDNPLAQQAWWRW